MPRSVSVEVVEEANAREPVHGLPSLKLPDHLARFGDLLNQAAHTKAHEAVSIGQIIDLTILRDRNTGQSKGAGFVTYATRESADTAIQLLHNQLRRLHHFHNRRKALYCRHQAEFWRLQACHP